MYKIENKPITTETKIADIVFDNPYSVIMLEHFGIELPFYEKTVGEICEEKHISQALFFTFANLYNNVPYSFNDSFTFTEINTIIPYLKKSHLYYSDEIYPKITRIIQQLNPLKNQTGSEMVSKFFNEYFNEVMEHLDYENDIVFPYIMEMFKVITGETQRFNQNNYSVDEYQEHHNDIEEKLDDLKNLLIRYLPQENDQAIRRELLLSLFQLDHDIKIHAQIEEMILIPLVSQMEKKLKK